MQDDGKLLFVTFYVALLLDVHCKEQIQVLGASDLENPFQKRGWEYVQKMNAPDTAQLLH